MQLGWKSFLKNVLRSKWWRKEGGDDDNYDDNDDNNKEYEDKIEWVK